MQKEIEELRRQRDLALSEVEELRQKVQVEKVVFHLNSALSLHRFDLQPLFNIFVLYCVCFRPLLTPLARLGRLKNVFPSPARCLT